jgi:hypothetical protein
MGTAHGAEELGLLMMMMMDLFCLSKRTPLLNGLGFSGTKAITAAILA